MSLGIASTAAHREYDRLCRTLAAHREVTLRDLGTALLLAEERTAPRPDPDRIAELCETLAIDPETLPTRDAA